MRSEFCLHHDDEDVPVSVCPICGHGADLGLMLFQMPETDEPLAVDVPRLGWTPPRGAGVAPLPAPPLAVDALRALLK